MKRKGSPRAVLDASALLAYLRQERGSSVIKAVIRESAISTVNLAEVLAKGVHYGSSLGESVLKLTSPGGLRTMDFTVEDARASADLRKQTRSLGLSMGDRACLALALRLGVPVFTTDRVWEKLDLPVDIRTVR